MPMQGPGPNQLSMTNSSMNMPSSSHGSMGGYNHSVPSSQSMPAQNQMTMSQGQPMGNYAPRPNMSMQPSQGNHGTPGPLPHSSSFTPLPQLRLFLTTGECTCTYEHIHAYKWSPSALLAFRAEHLGVWPRFRPSAAAVHWKPAPQLGAGIPVESSA